MKKNPLILSFVVLATAVAAWLVPLASLDAQGRVGEDQFLPLAKAIAEQQVQIEKNQVAIEADFAVIQEELRLTKIYVSRAGGPSK